LEVRLCGNHVNILYCDPPHAVPKLSMYTVCAEIIRKAEDGESIADYYRDELKSIGGFERAGAELKFLVNRVVSRMMSCHCDELPDSEKGSITKAYHLRTGSPGELLGGRKDLKSA
jgi:hypothetical protein